MKASFIAVDAQGRNTVGKWRHLISAAQMGDVDAFGAIVREFQDMAVGYAFSILGSFELAEDAAQEAFLQAYQDLYTLREPQAFPAWLRRLVFKYCDRQTRGKRLKTVPLDEAFQKASKEPDPMQAAEKSEIRERVLEAINSLPEHERTAVSLFYINGYSQAEVGEFLDVPAKTVKSRLYSARRKLRERMMYMVEDTLKKGAPGDGFAKFTIARTYLAQWFLEQNDDPTILDKALQMAEEYMDLEGADPYYGHNLLVYMYLGKKQYDLAMSELEKATELAPQPAVYHYPLQAIVCDCLGRSGETDRLTKKAIETLESTPSPASYPDRARYLTTLEWAYYFDGRYADAAQCTKELLDEGPQRSREEVFGSHLFLTILYSESGREEEAKAEAAEVLRAVPNFSVKRWGETFYLGQARVERAMAALRKAGLK